MVQLFTENGTRFCPNFGIFQFSDVPFLDIHCSKLTNLKSDLSISIISLLVSCHMVAQAKILVMESEVLPLDALVLLDSV